MRNRARKTRKIPRVSSPGVDITSIRQLTADPQNRRQHNPRNLAMLQASLSEVGASRSIVVDERGVILAGNGVVEAATALGLDRVKVVDVEGDTLVAVRRTGLTDSQKRTLAIHDNRTAELATWNWDQIEADRAAGLELAPWFTVEELAAGIGVVPTPPETFAAVDGSLPTEHQCPKCGYEWSGRSKVADAGD